MIKLLIKGIIAARRFDLATTCGDVAIGYITINSTLKESKYRRIVFWYSLVQTDRCETTASIISVSYR